MGPNLTVSANAILLGVLLTMGLLSTVFSRLEPGTRAVGAWGVSVMLLGVGYAMLQLHGREPTLVSVLSEIVILSSIGIMHSAVRRFDTARRVSMDLACWAWIAASSAALLWFTHIDPSARSRIIVFSGALAITLVWAAIVSVKLPGGVNRTARRVFSGVIWTIAALFFARMAGTLASQQRGDEYFRYDLLQLPAAAIGVLLIVALSVSLMWMEGSLIRARLAQMASHDTLTGLLNHRAVMEACERELSRADRYNEPIALAMLDLDGFKRINDAHGHAIGDEVLRHVAAQIADTLRDFDVCGHFGGEEFLVLMPQSDTAAAVACMEVLRARIAATPWVRGRLGIPVTVSIGVAERINHITGLDALIGAAERAVYRAKRAGRNRVETACSETGARPADVPPAVNFGEAPR